MTVLDKIQAVAFDCFGTLLILREPRNPWKHLLAEARRRHGQAPDPRREPIGTIEAFAAACGIGCRPEWRRDLDVELASITLAPGAIEILRHLRASGLRLALASNLAPPYVPVVMSLLGDLVDATCFSCSDGVRAVKPEAKFFTTLQTKLAVPAESVLMVGDSAASDVDGAQSAGMKALHLNPAVLDPGPGQIRNLYETSMALGTMDSMACLPRQEISGAEDHRARTQAHVLASLDLVNEQDAGYLLHIDPRRLPGGLRIREERKELIRLQRGGASFYLRAQFDAVNARTFPVVRHINLIKPSHMSSLRFCHWLSRPHVDFECAPAALFGREDAAILAAFSRAIEGNWHG